MASDSENKFMNATLHKLKIASDASKQDKIRYYNLIAANDSFKYEQYRNTLSRYFKVIESKLVALFKDPNPKIAKIAANGYGTLSATLNRRHLGGFFFTVLKGVEDSLKEPSSTRRAAFYLISLDNAMIQQKTEKRVKEDYLSLICQRVVQYFTQKDETVEVLFEYYIALLCDIVTYYPGSLNPFLIQCVDKIFQLIENSENPDKIVFRASLFFKSNNQSWKDNIPIIDELITKVFIKLRETFYKGKKKQFISFYKCFDTIININLSEEIILPPETVSNLVEFLSVIAENKDVDSFFVQICQCILDSSITVFGVLMMEQIPCLLQIVEKIISFPIFPTQNDLLNKLLISHVKLSKMYSLNKKGDRIDLKTNILSSPLILFRNHTNHNTSLACFKALKYAIQTYKNPFAVLFDFLDEIFSLENAKNKENSNKKDFKNSIVLFEDQEKDKIVHFNLTIILHTTKILSPKLEHQNTNTESYFKNYIKAVISTLNSEMQGKINSSKFNQINPKTVQNQPNANNSTQNSSKLIERNSSSEKFQNSHKTYKKDTKLLKKFQNFEKSENNIENPQKDAKSVVWRMLLETLIELSFSSHFATVLTPAKQFEICVNALSIFAESESLFSQWESALFKKVLDWADRLIDAEFGMGGRFLSVTKTNAADLFFRAIKMAFLAKREFRESIKDFVKKKITSPNLINLNPSVIESFMSLTIEILYCDKNSISSPLLVQIFSLDFPRNIYRKNQKKILIKKILTLNLWKIKNRTFHSISRFLCEGNYYNLKNSNISKITEYEENNKNAKNARNTKTTRALVSKIFLSFCPKKLSRFCAKIVSEQKNHSKKIKTKKNSNLKVKKPLAQIINELSDFAKEIILTAETDFDFASKVILIEFVKFLVHKRFSTDLGKPSETLGVFKSAIDKNTNDLNLGRNLNFFVETLMKIIHANIYGESLFSKRLFDEKIERFMSLNWRIFNSFFIRLYFSIFEMNNRLGLYKEAVIFGENCLKILAKNYGFKSDSVFLEKSYSTLFDVCFNLMEIGGEVSSNLIGGYVEWHSISFGVDKINWAVAMENDSRNRIESALKHYLLILESENETMKKFPKICDFIDNRIRKILKADLCGFKLESEKYQKLMKNQNKICNSNQETFIKKYIDLLSLLSSQKSSYSTHSSAEKISALIKTEILSQKTNTKSFLQNLTLLKAPNRATLQPKYGFKKWQILEVESQNLENHLKTAASANFPEVFNFCFVSKLVALSSERQKKNFEMTQELQRTAILTLSSLLADKENFRSAEYILDSDENTDWTGKKNSLEQNALKAICAYREYSLIKSHSLSFTLFETIQTLQRAFGLSIFQKNQKDIIKPIKADENIENSKKSKNLSDLDDFSFQRVIQTLLSLSENIFDKIKNARCSKILNNVNSENKEREIKYEDLKTLTIALKLISRMVSKRDLYRRETLVRFSDLLVQFLAAVQNDKAFFTAVFWRFEECSLIQKEMDKFFFEDLFEKIPNHGIIGKIEKTHLKQKIRSMKSRISSHEKSIKNPLEKQEDKEDKMKNKETENEKTSEKDKLHGENLIDFTEGVVKGFECIKGLAESAIKTMVKIVPKSKFRRSEALPIMLKIVSVLTEYSNYLDQEVLMLVFGLDSFNWELLFPLLLSKLSDKNRRKRRSLIFFQITKKIISENPKATVFPLLVSYKTNGWVYLQILVNYLEKTEPEKVQKTKRIIEEFTKIAYLLEEKCLFRISALKKSVKALNDYFISEFIRCASLPETKREKILLRHLNPIFNNLSELKRLAENEPNSSQEKNFLEFFGKKLSYILKDFKQLFIFVLTEPQKQEKIKNLKDCKNKLLKAIEKLETNLAKSSWDLKQISPYLYSLRGFSLPLPNGQLKLIYIKPKVMVLLTKTRPKKLVFVDKQGVEHCFLLKSKEDLRLDQRVIQFLNCYNATLNPTEEPLKAVTYPILPLPENCGLIKWVEGVTALYKVISFRNQRIAKTPENSGERGKNNITINTERNESLLEKNRLSLTSRCAKENGKNFFDDKNLTSYKDVNNHAFVEVSKIVRKKFSKTSQKLSKTGQNPQKNDKKSQKLDSLEDTKLEVFRTLEARATANLLEREFWLSSGETAEFYDLRVSFIQSVAVMSVLSHVLGLGDRHLGNILIDFSNGKAVHIDYNVCFGKGLKLIVPETVPFRLTKIMRGVLGIGGAKAFERTMMGVLEHVGSNRVPLLACLQTFAEEPLLENGKSELKKIEKDCHLLKKSLSVCFTHFSLSFLSLDKYFTGFFDAFGVIEKICNRSSIDLVSVNYCEKNWDKIKTEKCASLKILLRILKELDFAEKFFYFVYYRKSTSEIEGKLNRESEVIYSIFYWLKTWIFEPLFKEIVDNKEKTKRLKKINTSLKNLQMLPIFLKTSFENSTDLLNLEAKISPKESSDQCKQQIPIAPEDSKKNLNKNEIIIFEKGKNSHLKKTNKNSKINKTTKESLILKIESVLEDLSGKIKSLIHEQIKPFFENLESIVKSNIAVLDMFSGVLNSVVNESDGDLFRLKEEFKRRIIKIELKFGKEFPESRFAATIIRGFKEICDLCGVFCDSKDPVASDNLCGVIGLKDNLIPNFEVLIIGLRRIFEEIGKNETKHSIYYIEESFQLNCTEPFLSRIFFLLGQSRIIKKRKKTQKKLFHKLLNAFISKTSQTDPKNNPKAEEKGKNMQKTSKNDQKTSKPKKNENFDENWFKANNIYSPFVAKAVKALELELKRLKYVEFFKSLKEGSDVSIFLEISEESCRSKGLLPSFRDYLCDFGSVLGHSKAILEEESGESTIFDYELLGWKRDEASNEISLLLEMEKIAKRKISKQLKLASRKALKPFRTPSGKPSGLQRIFEKTISVLTDTKKRFSEKPSNIHSVLIKQILDQMDFLLKSLETFCEKRKEKIFDNKVNSLDALNTLYKDLMPLFQYSRIVKKSLKNFISRMNQVSKASENYEMKNEKRNKDFLRSLFVPDLGPDDIATNSDHSFCEADFENINKAAMEILKKTENNMTIPRHEIGPTVRRLIAEALDEKKLSRLFEGCYFLLTRREFF